MGISASLHKGVSDGDGDETGDSFADDNDHSSGLTIESPSSEDAIDRNRSQGEYEKSIWKQEELTREKRMHRGIAENIILEDFRRGKRMNVFYVVYIVYCACSAFYVKYSVYSDI